MALTPSMFTYGIPKHVIYLRMRTTVQIRTLLSLKRLKSFGHLSNLLKKTRLGLHYSEETEFLRLMQRKKQTFKCDSNQPSHAKATLTLPQKGLVRSPPWGT